MSRKATINLATTMTLQGNTTDGGTLAQNTAATLDTLMLTNLDTKDGKRSNKALGNAWRGATAYHFYM